MNNRESHYLAHVPEKNHGKRPDGNLKGPLLSQVLNECSHAYILLLLHPFNAFFSRTTWVSWYQKGKPFWILLEQEIMGWQWHELDQMQIICTSLRTANHASTSAFNFYRSDALPATQPTASQHQRHLFTSLHVGLFILINKLQASAHAYTIKMNYTCRSFSCICANTCLTVHLYHSPATNECI